MITRIEDSYNNAGGWFAEVVIGSKTHTVGPCHSVQELRKVCQHFILEQYDAAILELFKFYDPVGASLVCLSCKRSWLPSHMKKSSKHPAKCKAGFTEFPEMVRPWQFLVGILKRCNF